MRETERRFAALLAFCDECAIDPDNDTLLEVAQWKSEAFLFKHSTETRRLLVEKLGEPTRPNPSATDDRAQTRAIWDTKDLRVCAYEWPWPEVTSG